MQYDYITDLFAVKEQVSLESLQVVQQNKAPTISVARERWRKAIKRVSANRRLQAVVIRYSSVMREGTIHSNTF